MKEDVQRRPLNDPAHFIYTPCAKCRSPFEVSARTFICLISPAYWMTQLDTSHDNRLATYLYRVILKRGTLNHTPLELQSPCLADRIPEALGTTLYFLDRNSVLFEMKDQVRSFFSN